MGEPTFYEKEHGYQGRVAMFVTDDRGVYSLLELGIVIRDLSPLDVIKYLTKNFTKIDLCRLIVSPSIHEILMGVVKTHSAPAAKDAEFVASLLKITAEFDKSKDGTDTAFKLHTAMFHKKKSDPSAVDQVRAFSSSGSEPFGEILDKVISAKSCSSKDGCRMHTILVANKSTGQGKVLSEWLEPLGPAERSKEAERVEMERAIPLEGYRFSRIKKRRPPASVKGKVALRGLRTNK